MLWLQKCIRVLSLDFTGCWSEWKPVSLVLIIDYVMIDRLTAAGCENAFRSQQLENAACRSWLTVRPPGGPAFTPSPSFPSSGWGEGWGLARRFLLLWAVGWVAGQGKGGPSPASLLWFLLTGGWWGEASPPLLEVAGGGWRVAGGGWRARERKREKEGEREVEPHVFTEKVRRLH